MGLILTHQSGWDLQDVVGLKESNILGLWLVDDANSNFSNAQQISDQLQSYSIKATQRLTQRKEVDQNFGHHESSWRIFVA